MSEPLTLHDKLVDIQNRLNVPKDQHNSFGNYNYRNIEQIEAAVKPLLKEYGLTLRFDDTVTEVGGRVYVCASAMLEDAAGGVIAVDGWAREAETKKGMDDSQITGACSSYARKYAAGGLFLIDNGQDADSMDSTKQRASTKATGATAVNTRSASPKSQEWMRDVAEKYVPLGMDVDDWIERVLTVKPGQVPQFKVKDAVDKLNEVGTQQARDAQRVVDDTIIPVTDEPINLDEVDY